MDDSRPLSAVLFELCSFYAFKLEPCNAPTPTNPPNLPGLSTTDSNGCITHTPVKTATVKHGAKTHHSKLARLAEGGSVGAIGA